MNGNHRRPDDPEPADAGGDFAAGSETWWNVATLALALAFIGLVGHAAGWV